MVEVGPNGDETRAARGASPSGIAFELGGDLPCARCRYNLRGLSIRAVCPECAVPVRATLLAVVDPLADELRPVRARLATATGVALWPIGGIVCMIAMWGMELVPLVSQQAGYRAADSLRWASVLGVAISALGACALVLPHAGIRVRDSVQAGVGVLLTGLVGWLLYRGLVMGDAGSSMSFFDLTPAEPSRHVWRALVMMLSAIAIVALRPNARVLASRSLLMRSGQVDRQTLRVLAVVVVLGMLPDAAILSIREQPGEVADLVRIGAKSVTLLTAVLFTMGLFGVLIDCLRLRGVILEPPLSLRSLLATPD